MESTLEAILINTYNPDQQLRSQAEAQLNHFILTNGALISLLKYVGNVNNHRELRQATSIVIKNKMRDFWSDDSLKTCNMNTEEKDVVKQLLIDILLIEIDNSIRGILAESIRIVSETEFPERWPQLIPTILANIQNNDVLKIYNSLLALRKVAKRYEYKQKADRQPLYDIIQTSFPYLQQLFDMVSQHNTIEAAQVMKMCLKIFWSATMYQLPLVSGVDVNFWFVKIAEVLNKILPEASEGLEPQGQPISIEDRVVWPWWKLKKWAARISSQFIQRYGNPRYASDETKTFAEYFRSHVAAQLLAPAMNTLAHKAKGCFVTDDVQRMCISYVTACVEMSPTYKILKPHLEFILVSIVFPTLCLTDEDLRLFHDDPVEFVRKIHDPLGDWLSPLIAATNLLQMLARYRQKDTLPIFLPFIQGILLDCANATHENRNYRKKDGALVSIAVLAKILQDSKTYKSLLHPFLETHVIPEFESPIAFIRSRAMWVIEYFHDLNWTYANGIHLQAVLRGLINGLRDPALPVQAAAACSLRLLIAADGATDLVRPMLPQIIAEYFRIMEEVENESVLNALQAIILKFGEDVSDMAPMIVTHLVALFRQYISAGDDDEEATFNACQCLDTIDAVLEAVQERPDVMLLLEPIVQPLLLTLLVEGDSLFEYIDSAVHMISSFTYYSNTITPTMWTLCGPLLQVLNDWAIDYISEIMVPILNYICKDIGTFLQGNHKGEPFVYMLLNIVAKVFGNGNDESYSAKDSGCAATMVTCLITTCHGMQALHSSLQQIIALVLTQLKTIKSKSLRIRLLEIIMACLYYDTEATLAVLLSDPSSNVGHNLFTLMFDTLPDMDKDFTQRLIVLSFSSVISVPSSKLPEFICKNFQSMFQQIIRELVMIQEEAGKERNDDFETADDYDEDDEDNAIDDDTDDEVDDDEDDENEFDENDSKQAKHNRAKALYVPDGGYDEDEDCLNAEDESYRETLEALGKEEEDKQITKYQNGDMYADNDDESMEDFTFTSPIENMNMIQYFLDTMNKIEQRDGNALTASLQHHLDETDKQRLQDLMNTAQQIQLLLQATQSST